MMNQMTMTEKVNAKTNKSDANNALINCVFQNSKNNVRNKRTRAARRKNLRQPEQEVAPVPSLLAFPIEWRQLEAEQRRNAKMHKKACENTDNYSTE